VTLASSSKKSGFTSALFCVLPEEAKTAKAVLPGLKRAVNEFADTPAKSWGVGLCRRFVNEGPHPWRRPRLTANSFAALFYSFGERARESIFLYLNPNILVGVPWQQHQEQPRGALFFGEKSR
jgi:hypothetical protein